MIMYQLNSFPKLTIMWLLHSAYLKDCTSWENHYRVNNFTAFPVVNHLPIVLLPRWKHQDQSTEGCGCKEQFTHSRHDWWHFDTRSGRFVFIPCPYDIQNWNYTHLSCKWTIIIDFGRNRYATFAEWTIRKNPFLLHILVGLTRHFSLLQNHPERLCCSFSLLFNGYLPPFSEVKRWGVNLTTQLNYLWG